VENDHSPADGARVNVTTPLPTAITALLRRAEIKGVRSTDRDCRVWELKGSHSGVEQVRCDVLAQVFAARSRLVLAYDEDAPDLPALAAHVFADGAGAFELRGEPPVSAMRGWLSYGNWQLMSPRMPPALQDLARARPESVTRFVDEHGLEFVIDSFHDDVFWIIGLAQ
jgi:hypothetical protein